MQTIVLAQTTSIVKHRRTPDPGKPPPNGTLPPGMLAIEMSSQPSPRLWVGVDQSIDPTGRRLVQLGGGGATVISGTTPPLNPIDNQLWWDAGGGQLYLRYNDGNSAQWVIASPSFYGSGGGGTMVSIGAVPPAGPTPGQLWWDTVGGQMYIWFNDGSSAQWVICGPSFYGGDPSPGTPGAAMWGRITGTLSEQTDLIAALNGKQNLLTSGSNIRTVNGNNLLGTGDISTTQLGAVPASGGGMSGNLTVAGGIRVGAVGVPATGTLLINRNPAPPSVPMGSVSVPLHISGNDGENPLCVFDAYSSLFALRFARANGTGQFPTQVIAGDGLGNLAWQGYGASDWVGACARIHCLALEDFTNTQEGCQVTITATPVGQGGPVTQAAFGPGLTVGNPTPVAGMQVGDLNAQRIFLNGTSLGGSTGLPLTGGTLTGPLAINLNTSAALPDPAVMAGNVFPLRLAAPDGQGLHMYFDSFGNGCGIHFRRTGGSNVSKAPLADTDQLGFLTFHGWDGAAYSVGQAAVSVYATGFWSTVNHGTEMRFLTTKQNETGMAPRMRINGAGAVEIEDLEVHAITVPSDRRLKEQVEPYRRGLAAVCRLNPISFRYRDGNGAAQVSLDAEDISKIIPEMVGTLTAREIDGTPVKSISPLTLVYALTNAVKELAGRLDALEARFA